MKKIPFLSLIIFLFFSCNKTDRTDYNSIAKVVDRALQKQDLEMLRPLYGIDMDSINTSEKEQIKNTFNLFKKNELMLLQVEFNIKQHKTDTDLVSLFYKPDECFGSIPLAIYYKDVQSNIYRVCVCCTQRNDSIFLGGKNQILEKTYYFGTITSTNLTELQKKYDETPYRPRWEIQFETFSWYTYGYGKSQGFESLRVHLQNNSTYDIDYLKFRLIIKNNYIPIFNQTIEIHQKIFKGDMTIINIPALKNFYVGKFSEYTLSWEHELMEVFPKPKFEWEDKIEELKQMTR